MTSVLITGASGFIGGHLARAFVGAGCQVSGIARRAAVVGDVSVSAVDCRTDSLLRYAAREHVDVVVHAACLLPGSAPSCDLLLDNIAMTRNVIAACRVLQASRIVYLSSTAVDVQPLTPYGASKLVGEMLCAAALDEFPASYAILRISAPYGPGMPDTVLRKFVMAAVRDGPISVWGTGARTQDFTHIDDVTAGVVGAALSENTGTAYISSGISTRMLRLAEIVIAAVPGSASKIAVGGTDDPQDGYRSCAPIQDAERLFDYNPKYRVLRDGIARYVEEIKRGNL